MNALSRFAEVFYAVMRVDVGLLFACHGAQKILGWFGGHGGAQGMMLLGGIVELGGLLIAVGLLTRVFAFLAAGMMAVAYFMVHAHGGFFPIVNKGEPAVIYCFVFLYIFFRGGGRYSLDALLFR